MISPLKNTDIFRSLVKDCEDTMISKLTEKFEVFCKEEAKCPFPGSKKLEENYCKQFCNIYKFLEFLEREEYKIIPKGEMKDGEEKI